MSDILILCDNRYILDIVMRTIIILIYINKFKKEKKMKIKKVLSCLLAVIIIGTSGAISVTAATVPHSGTHNTNKFCAGRAHTASDSHRYGFLWLKLCNATRHVHNTRIVCSWAPLCTYTNLIPNHGCDASYGHSCGRYNTTSCGHSTGQNITSWL